MKAADQRTTNRHRSLQSFKLKTYIQVKSKTIDLNRFIKWKTGALADLALVAFSSTPALAGNNDNEQRWGPNRYGPLL